MSVLSEAQLSHSHVPLSCCPFYGWTIALICMVSKLMKCQGQNNIMSFTVPHLLKELKLTDGELGILFSIGTILSSTVQPFLGRAVDRLGARICVPVAQFTLSLTLVGFATVRHVSMKLLVYVQVVIVFFFIRALCLGALETFPNACVQRWFVRRRGRAVSLMSTAQWIGISFMGLVVAWLVSEYSWRGAAIAGAILNAIMALITALLLRSCPEDSGLLPDGDGHVVQSKPDLDFKSTRVDPMENEEVTLVPRLASEKFPPSLWMFFLFSFFFSVVYSGCDFYMMEIVAENPGAEEHIDIAGQIFAPLALVCGTMAPFLGEAMDRCKSVTLAYCFVGFAGVFACIATNILCFANTAVAALAYAVLRGLSFAVHMALVNSGLVFAAMGVTSDRIGSVLGKNSLAGIAGTGVGPLCFGLANDALGTFDPSLQASSIPMLLIGAAFIVRACQMRSADGMTLDTDDAAMQPSVLGKGSDAREFPPDDLTIESPLGYLVEAGMKASREGSLDKQDGEPA